jgi:hypothetical protein
MEMHVSGPSCRYWFHNLLHLYLDMKNLTAPSGLGWICDRTCKIPLLCVCWIFTWYISCLQKLSNKQVFCGNRPTKIILYPYFQYFLTHLSDTCYKKWPHYANEQLRVLWNWVQWNPYITWTKMYWLNVSIMKIGTMKATLYFGA